MKTAYISIRFGELSSTSESIGFVNFRSKLELSSSYEKFGVWTGPKSTSFA